MNVTWTPQIVPAVLAFVGLLIFVHELGHFLFAKLFDIKVERFSLGFGPPLVRFVKGETTYQIAIIPLGGYVKMVGQDPHEDISPEDLDRAFSSAPVYQRGIVALAGPAFNIIFPVICFFAYNLLEPLQQPALVGTAELGRPAQIAGFLPGDQIVQIDDERVWSFERMTTLVRARPGVPTKVEVLRDDERVTLEVTPAAVTGRDPFGSDVEFGQIGITALMPAARIGVFDVMKSPGDFKTGDRIAKIDGQDLKVAYELDRQLRKLAGKTVEVVSVRAQDLRAGALLGARAEEAIVQQVNIPEGTQGMADLGWAPSGPFIRDVVPGGAAQRAGLQGGDQIVEVKGQEIRLFWSFLQAVETGQGEPLDLVVVRDGQRKSITLTATEVTCINDVTLKPGVVYDHGLGVGWMQQEEPECGAVVAAGMTTHASWYAYAPSERIAVRLSIGEAFLLSLDQTWDVTQKVGAMLFKFFTGGVSYKNLGGPITFFRVAAMAAEQGVMVYLSLLAVLSINLALFNLLPIPILDGGHLLFCLIEAVKRKPVSLRVREQAMVVGMVLLLALFVLAMGNDLAKLGLF